MRRLVNLCLILVLLGAVGFLLVRARIIHLPERSGGGSQPTPSVAPLPPRENLRISVARRPEILIVTALQRMLEANSLKVEIVAFDPETTWMELAAGELDLVVAPIGDAVTAQARFNCGRFLFVSGLSEGYDTIVAKTQLTGLPLSLGIVGGRSGELFAIRKFPEARLLIADDQTQLQSWLTEGAVQAAVLESAGLKGELAQKAVKIGGTSSDAPMPTVVVLSQTLAQETPENQTRLKILTAALHSWSDLIGYLSSQPELLRSTLRPEANDMGVDLDKLLTDYRFLAPAEGRQALLQGDQEGLLRQTLDLLVLAKTSNLTSPDWEKTLALPSLLDSLLNSPVGAIISPTPDSTATPAPSGTPTAEASPSMSTTSLAFAGTNYVSGSALPFPWPEPVTFKVDKTLDLACALTDTQVGLATTEGFTAHKLDGTFAFNSKVGGAPVSSILADPSTFYVSRAGQLQAIDEKGDVVWTCPFKGSPGQSPLLTETHVIMTLSSKNKHRVIAVARENGDVSWEKTLKGAPSSSPIYAATPKSRILIIDESGELTAWNAQTGEVDWQKDWQIKLFKPLSLATAVRGDVLAVTSPDGHVALLSLVDGQKIWENQLGTGLAAAPTVTDSAVLLPATDNTVYTLSRETGDVQENKVSLKSLPSSPLVVVGENAYLCDETGGAHGFSLSDKLTLEWSLSLSDTALRSPVFSAQNFALLSADGTVRIYPR